MQTNRIAVLVLALALGLATVGCGSSSDGDASPTTAAAGSSTTEGGGDDTDAPDSPEKAAFLEAADRICKESGDEIDKKADELDGSTDVSDAELEAFFTMAAQETNAQIAAVRALGLPEEDAEELDQAFGVLEEAFAAVAEDPKTLLEATSTPEFEEATTYLNEYGFQECGASR
ncbi:MAG: hypothetical protein R2746_11040 [Acidimicrobiales bacterium]